jgi:hypothetical protein
MILRSSREVQPPDSGVPAVSKASRTSMSSRFHIAALRNGSLTGRGRARVHDINVQADDNRRVPDAFLNSANNLGDAIVIDVECMDQLEASGDVVVKVRWSLATAHQPRPGK